MKPLQSRLARLERRHDVGNDRPTLFIVLNRCDNEGPDAHVSIQLADGRGLIRSEPGETFAELQERAQRMSPGQQFFIALRGPREESLT